jgi:exodeoxyribonuclease VII small subunit
MSRRECASTCGSQTVPSAPASRIRTVAETELTFEQAQTELEGIVERLEKGQASLDEALALWERGEQLYAFCREKLDGAQGKVEELARRVEQARPEPQP